MVRCFCSVLMAFALLVPLAAVLAADQVLAADRVLAADEGPLIQESRGQTMGTSYVVKVADPPEDFPDDWTGRIDAELRRVNDQMSTYLETSEISRFNASDSTEWFEVSPETAQVVAKSLEIHQLSQGAFDITVAPLVDAWSFGPGKRTSRPPEPAVIERLLANVGSEKLAVRLQPPSLRKSEPGLTIDLSAIAKGHGVDRITELLGRLGAANTFVEIGGEVRATGDKRGSPWTVGIQQPDVLGEVVAVAHPLRNEAVATSGDYRNYFEFAGRRYSHTLDPRTGRPVDHTLASVSVFAADCMTADAWATAINVLGPDAGLRVAGQQQLDTLLMIRNQSAEISSVGTGRLAASAAGVDDAAAAAPPRWQASLQYWLLIASICLVAFVVILAGMAIGVIFGRRSIAGSCGGLSNQRNADGEASCALCSDPGNACRELQEKMRAKDSKPGSATTAAAPSSEATTPVER